MKKIGVYSIKSPSNKFYIGSSKDIDKRWREYRNLRCKSQTKLYNSFLKYGVESHIFKIELECEENERLHWEHHFSNYYKSIDNGLNLRIPGYNEVPGIVSKEARQKMIQNHPSKNNHNYIIRNKEHLKKVVNSENFKEKVKKYWTDEKRNNKSIAFKQYWESLSQKDKEARIKKRIDSRKSKNNGNFHTDDFKAKLSERGKGKKLSQEQRLKISLNSRNKKKILCIETNQIFNSIGDVKNCFNISHNTILRNIKGTTKKNKTKFNFRYLCQQEEKESQVN